MRSFLRLECCCRHRYIRTYNMHWLASVTLTSIQFRWISTSLLHSVMYSRQVKVWQLLSSGLSLKTMLESQWEEKGSSGRWIITINAHAHAHMLKLFPRETELIQHNFIYQLHHKNPANQSYNWEMCSLTNSVIQMGITQTQYISLSMFSWGLSHLLNKSHSCHVGPLPVTPHCSMHALCFLKSVPACAHVWVRFVGITMNHYLPTLSHLRQD